MRRSVKLWLILVLLLAFALRLYRIQSPSLWNDEGTSIALAGRSLAAITQGAANDIHPPLYYYLLHFWMGLFGRSEFAARALSAMLGTWLVLCIFALGRWSVAHSLRNSAGAAVGLLAALFSALSPFQVYYSQETRMYMLSALLGALSTLLLLRLLSGRSAHARGRFLSFAGYLLSSTLLLYTHYFAATLVIAHNLAFLYWWLFAPRNRGELGEPRSDRLTVLLRWGAIQLAIVALFVPWLRLAAGQLGRWPAISEPLRPGALLLDLLRVFSLGLSVAPHASLALVGFGLLLLVGAVAPFFGPRDEAPDRPGTAQSFVPQFVYLLTLLVPVLAMYVLSLSRPMYNPKFLLLCTPAFYVFLAHGTVFLSTVIQRFQTHSLLHAKDGMPVPTGWALPRILGTLVLVGFVAVASGRSLQGYYFDARYARDDYRGIAQYIQAMERDGDVVLINAPGQVDTFAYYYRGRLPLYLLPRQRPLDEAQTEADLAQMSQQRGRIFAVLWATDESDPKRFIEGWLDRQAYKAMDSWYGNVRLVVYALPLEASSAAIEYALQANLGDQVRLLGYNLPTPEVMPGDILQLSLFWQAMVPMQQRYKVFTHILDAHGHMVGQRDAEPGGGAKITTVWKLDEQVIDNYGLLILPATPPGEYVVEIGMYNLETGQRLPVMEADQAVSDHVLLRPVRILPAAVPPPLSVLGMKRQLHATFGDVTLLGYDLDKLGFEHQPDAPLHSGDVLHLTLFWQAQAQPSHEVALTIQLRDDKGNARQEQRSEPTEGLYPSLQWRADEIVRDQHTLPLPNDLTPGRYSLQLSVQLLPQVQPVRPSLILTTLSLQ